MKRVLKWLGILFLVGVVLFVALILSIDPILRVMMQNNIRQQTGMTAEIGAFHLGLLKPVISIKDLKLNNPPAFGGAPFLNIPEIYVEYDRDALAKNELRLTLVRFNLGELAIVKNEAGKTNLFELGVNLPDKKALEKISKEGDGKGLELLKQRTGMEFKGVDVLNISIGTAKYIDLAEPKNNREQNIGIENQVMKNVKTPADLAGLALLVALRSDNFFTPFATPMLGK